MPDDPPQHQATHPCPACGQTVEFAAGLLQCPACGEQFIIDDQPAELEIDTPAISEAELDARRIERISKLRRSVYRSRSHAIIATVVCAVAAIQLAISLGRAVRMSELTRRSVLYAALLASAIFGVRFFARSAIVLHRQAKSDHPTG